MEKTSKELILIVDDSAVSLRVLAAMLESNGYRTEKATNGNMALQTIETTKPDLILLDINMPGMSGYEVCQTLKAQKEHQSTPVIFLSAMDEIINKEQAFQVGGIDYITKPYRIKEVLIRIENQLNQVRLYQKLQRRNEELQNEIAKRHQAEAALMEANRQLELLAALDGLTGIANRRKFDERLALEWKRAMREQLPISLILTDIDFFKAYNDTYGHLAGDDCLQQIAMVLQSSTRRPLDLAARYGGEEFALLLPNTGLDGARVVARQLQSHVEALAIPHKSSLVMPIVTLSSGVASIMPTSTSNSDVLIERADQALYQAKATGRNQCLDWDSLPKKSSDRSGETTGFRFPFPSPPPVTPT